MKIENVQVFNFEGALRGMRNPLESWDRSDTVITTTIPYGEEPPPDIVEVKQKWEKYLQEKKVTSQEMFGMSIWNYLAQNMITHTIGNSEQQEAVLIGPKDMELAVKLINGGSEHRKFLRQIMVSFDMTTSSYIYKEFDTYKINVTANSTSTMHKLATTPITLECFETDDYNDRAAAVLDIKDFIAKLEKLRQLYLETKDIRYWKELIRWLPSGWLYKRTITLNYENLRNIVAQRKNHKLTEWHTFVDWVKTLPYADKLIF